MNQTVAVTGATGFIGKYIIDNLLARGFHVRALTRTARAHVNDNLIWVRGSLEDTHSLSELVAGASAVVHCAGQVRGHKEEIFTRCNVDGSLRLMQAAKESGFCQRFLFISSLAARHPELSWYANSKHVAEQRLTAMADEITLGVFRPTAVYGPGDKELKPLFDWMLRGLLPRLGAPDTQLSFLHVTDFAQAVGQWLSAETVQTQTYELCDGVAGGYDWQRVRQLAADARPPFRAAHVDRGLHAPRVRRPFFERARIRIADARPAALRDEIGVSFERAADPLRDFRLARDVVLKGDRRIRHVRRIDGEQRRRVLRRRRTEQKRFFHFSGRLSPPAQGWSRMQSNTLSSRPSFL